MIFFIFQVNARWPTPSSSLRDGNPSWQSQSFKMHQTRLPRRDYPPRKDEVIRSRLPRHGVSASQRQKEKILAITNFRKFLLHKL